ncbi:MAG: transposase [bacterium]|nr:transposase [bacterium]
MTTAKSQFARPIGAVKQELLSAFGEAIDGLFAAAGNGAPPRQLEEGWWELLLPAARQGLGYAFGFLCQQATEADIEARGLSSKDVKVRTDQDYWMTVTTTFGDVRFPSFAYRDASSGAWVVTRTPARGAVFPLHARCRSSELCLEWEARLGSTQAFRRAEQTLTFFTHGSVKLEDTTIARHTVRIGTMVEPEWLYKPPSEIREILATRATRDRKSGLPILYASLDAHALRRYVDETWDAAWKMANGHRLWCVDRETGAIIHLGGEYIWGDSDEVKAIFERLIGTGHLPVDGDYGEGVNARLVFVTDGMPWIQDLASSCFPTAAVILDAYHVMERLAKYAALRYGKGSKRAKRFYDKALRWLFGKRDAKKRGPIPRKGHKKTRRKGAGCPAADKAFQMPPVGGAEKLLKYLEGAKRVPKRALEAHEKLLGYIGANLARMDYLLYRALGLQIGSGAMESLHRTGSQARLKVPGARWLKETSQAIFNLRMLDLVGRWDEFWGQRDFTHQLVAAFAAPQNGDPQTLKEAA